MPRPRIQVPILLRTFHGTTVREIEVVLAVRTARQSFVPVTFLFDTGANLTTLPIADARRLGIPHSLEQPTTVQTSAGPARAFLSPLVFSFPDLPQVQFETLACFTPTPLRRSLLGLTDVLSHFHLRSLSATRASPGGYLRLELRARHGGLPRRDRR